MHMENSTDNLRDFLNHIKSLNLFSRIFKWKKVKELYIEAYADFQKILFNSGQQNDKISELNSSKLILEKDLERKNQLEIELAGLNTAHIHLQKERDLLKNENIKLLTEEDMRKNKYEADVNSLNSIREKIETDRQKEIEANQRKEIEAYRKYEFKLEKS